MNSFIKEQIDSYHGKKYSIKNDLQPFANNPLYLYIKIIDNKVIATNPPNQFYNQKHSLDRKKRIIKMIQNSIKLNKIDNTYIIIKLFDTYEWTYDIPCFNLSLPKNKQGFIFPHYDFIKFNKLGIDYDTIKLNMQNYNPKVIENNIYFKGNDTTSIKSNIRFMLSELKYPFSIKLSNDISGDNTEPLYFLKKHKYLLDLPGFQPWSVRFKYLCLCERVFIRISFYNSKFEEKDYWKQFSDLYFRENIDYIHLKYDIDFEKKPLSKKLFIKISKDIENIYNKFEQNPNLYKQMVNNLKKSSDKLSSKNVYEYISKMINSYTKNLLID